MKRFTNGLCVALALWPVAAHSYISPGLLSPRQIMEQDTASLIQAPYAPPPLFFSSTDAKHQNEDFITLKPGESKRIPLAAGKLVRLWSTALEPDKIELSVRGLTPYGDGPATQTLLSSGKALWGSYENKTYLWYSGNDSLTVRELGKGAVLEVCNSSKALNKWFYQATVRPGEQGNAVPPSIAVPPVPLKNIVRGDGKITVPSKGAALLTTLKVRFSVAPDNDALHKIRLLVNLQAKGTGAVVPLIDVPFGPLVGSFQGAAGPLRDAMTNWDGKALTLRWPMPFDGARQQMQIEVTGAPAALEADVTNVPSLDPYRFHAAYGSQVTVQGKPIPILKVNGEGAFAGLRMSVSPTADSGRRSFAYLEGNETITADGKAYEGTGTEDSFNSAWYFPDKPFSRPYGGLTERTALPPKVSMYRLMIPDSVPFKRTLQFDFEVGKKNNADDLEYRWVAFWYQKESGTVAIEDALKGAGGDTAANALAAPGVNNNANNVRSLPELPLWVEMTLGIILLGAVLLSLSAIFRRKKV